METLQPTEPHTHTFIFLHGRDSTAAEFMREFFESQASDDRTLPEIFPQVKWVFPTSGILPSRYFGDISQWYDMSSTDNPADGESEHQNDIDAAVASTLALLRSETAVLGSSQGIILGGISQGCAVAIQALLKQDLALGGFMGLSSWLPASVSSMDLSEQTKRTPIFLSHSKDDDTIDVKHGERLRDALKAKDMAVEWQPYPVGDHWINEPQGIGEFLQ